MTKKQQFSKQLSTILPEYLALTIAELIVDNNIFFRVSKDRKSKLGDYRYIPQERKHLISVNQGLGPTQFFITAIHEFAHFFAFKNHGRKIKPHGLEWRYEYRKLLSEVLEFNSLESEMIQAVQMELQKPTVAHRSSLSRELMPGEVYLSSVSEHSVFEFRDRKFIKKEIRRTRFFCECIVTKKLYTIHKEAIVKQL